jgi:hypothetical protein
MIVTQTLISNMSQDIQLTEYRLTFVSETALRESLLARLDDLRARLDDVQRVEGERREWRARVRKIGPGSIYQTRN